MKYKAVIFDLDGTLFYSLPDIAFSINTVLKEYNFKTHTEEEVRMMIGNGFRKLVERALPKESLRDTDFVNEFEEKARNYYKENMCNYSRLYKGIDSLLDYLKEKSFSLNINTNKPHALVAPIVEHYLKKWNFEYCEGQLKGRAIKPEPDTAFYICEKLNLQPKDCLFVGDSTVDMATAKNSGMKSIAVTWGFGDKEDLEAAQPDYIVDTPEDIITIIQEN